MVTLIKVREEGKMLRMTFFNRSGFSLAACSVNTQKGAIDMILAVWPKVTKQHLVQLNGIFPELRQALDDKHIVWERVYA